MCRLSGVLQNLIYIPIECEYSCHLNIYMNVHVIHSSVILSEEFFNEAEQNMKCTVSIVVVMVVQYMLLQLCACHCLSHGVYLLGNFYPVLLGRKHAGIILCIRMLVLEVVLKFGCLGPFERMKTVSQMALNFDI